MTGQIWPAKAQPHVPCPLTGASSPRHHLPQALERTTLFPWALQLWSSSLLVPGARICYFPGQGRYPSLSQMTVLVSHTLSKLFFFFPVLSSPFLAMLSVKDPVALCAPRQPLHGIWSPKGISQQSLVKGSRMQGKMDLTKWEIESRNALNVGFCLYQVHARSWAKKYLLKAQSKWLEQITDSVPQPLVSSATRQLHPHDWDRRQWEKNTIS